MRRYFNIHNVTIETLNGRVWSILRPKDSRALLPSAGWCLMVSRIRALGLIRIPGTQRELFPHSSEDSKIKSQGSVSQFTFINIPFLSCPVFLSSIRGFHRCHVIISCDVPHHYGYGHGVFWFQKTWKRLSCYDIYLL